MSRRVVITGVGAISAAGASGDALWSSLISSSPGSGSLEVPGVGTLAAARAPEGDAEEAFGRKEARRMDRVARLAALAASEALAQAGEMDLPSERIGAAIGCCHGGMATLDAGAATLAERGGDRISPLTVPLSLPNSSAATVARVHGLEGPSLCPATACAAGSDAIGQAMALIRAGRAEAMVAGGAEAPLVPLVLAGYHRLGALSSSDSVSASRPFDQSRDGFVIAEGAGVVVLEEREHALARGAEVLAELAGYGSCCDAGHITDPDPAGTGPARAIRESLNEAGAEPGDVSYVNAHATSTLVGDLAEARALVGAGLSDAPVSATKSVTGHPLGAAGGLEAVATVLAIHNETVPPTANLTTPEPEPALDHVMKARPGPIGVAISNSFGFGGHNATLTFRAPD